jgi:hypothetical protein
MLMSTPTLAWLGEQGAITDRIARAIAWMMLLALGTSA